MNQFDNLAEDERRFDRLVDGEMDSLERRRFLASLDEEPGGWRRCAMAFLEAQAWRESMPAEMFASEDLVVAGLAEPDHHDGSMPDPGQPSHPSVGLGPGEGRATVDRTGFVRLAVAMAVCFAVAFFLGTEFRQRWTSGPVTSLPSPPRHSGDAIESTASATPPLAESPANPADVIPWGQATFVLDDEGHEVAVPVFDLDPYAKQVLLENSTAAIDSLRDQFERVGFDVRRDVSWSPIEMGGGQRMMVPIADLVISPISHRAIQ